MLSKKCLADVEKRVQDVRAAGRWIKAPYLAAIPSGMEASTAPHDLAADLQFLLGETTMLGSKLHAAENEASLLTSSLDCAERALHAAGFTLKEGAQEWRPPLGQSASPLLDTIDQLREQVASLQSLCCTKATEQGVRDLLESLKLKFSTPVDALLTNMGAAGNQRAFEELESINHRGEQDVQALTVAYAQKAMRVKELEAELEAVGAGGVQSLRKVEKKIPEKARSISDDMMDMVDRLGGEWADVDPRAWAHLMVYAPKPAAQPVNQQMLEALRATVAEDESLIEECKRQGHPLPDDMLVIYRQCKDAIAQAEAEAEAQQARKPSIDALRAAIKNGTAHADGDCEAKWVESEAHLNCPACGGSGHVDDVKQPVRELPTDAIIKEKACLSIEEGRSWRGEWHQTTELAAQLAETFYESGWRAGETFHGIGAHSGGCGACGNACAGSKNGCRVAEESPPISPEPPDNRLKVKLGSQYGRDISGHWFYLQPADEYAGAALCKHCAASAKEGGAA